MYFYGRKTTVASIEGELAMKHKTVCIVCVVGSLVILAMCVFRQMRSFNGSLQQRIPSPLQKSEVRMISDVELTAKCTACSNAVATLKTGDVDEFVSCMSDLQLSLESLNNEQVGKVVKPLEEFVLGECTGDGPNTGYSDSISFERYAETLRAAVLQLGDIRLMAGPTPAPVVRIYESLVLEHYRHCWKKARKESRGDLASAAKREYDAWRKRIESKEGLTRRYMNKVLEHDESVMRSLSGLTRWNLIKGVRSASFDLVMTGVVPRWIDEDFGYDCQPECKAPEIGAPDWDPGASVGDALRDVCLTVMRDLPGGRIESCEEFRVYSMRLEDTVRKEGERLLNGSAASGSRICTLEAGVLELLWKYCRWFAMQGCQDCAETAHAELARWKEFVDSREGLTRRWSESVIKLATDDRDLERALKDVRLQIYKFVLSGYTPLWTHKLPDGF